MSIGMIFGAQYYRPPFPDKSVWQRDINSMRRKGFNTVKQWAVWNWIEREPGVYNFDDLDELVELAARNGLQTVINAIPEGAPYWALEENRDSLYVTHRGEAIEWGGPPNIPTAGWPGFCWDSPVAQQMMMRFIEATARHYSGCESVLSIDVWNEPHLEPMLDYKQEMLCYCSHSRAQFIKWLDSKYGDIETLNRSWFRTYSSWDEVSPPPRLGTGIDMMDWRLFWIENQRRWLQMRVGACRRGAPDIPVQTHAAHSGVLGNDLQGGMANEVVDEFVLAGEVDIFGLTSFPKWLQGPDHLCTHLAHCEIVAEASSGKPFYQVELQGGAGKNGLLGGEVPTYTDVRLWNYNTVAAGGKGVLYWQYSPEPAGLESPGFGLTGFAGEETERSRAAAECAQEFDTAALAGAKRVPPVNAIYVSRQSDLFCYSAGRQEALYAGSVNGLYKAAYRAGIPVRFFHEDAIERLPEEPISVLYLPMTLTLSRHEIDRLAEFVEKGGTLIGEAFPGMYDQSGLLDLSATALGELFGLGHKEVQATENWGRVRISMSSSGEQFFGTHYRHLTIPQAGTEVVGLFEDGEPAMMLRRAGGAKGQAIFCGSFPSLDYHLHEDSASLAVLTRELYSPGYTQLNHIGFSDSAAVVRLLENESSYIIMAVNHTPAPTEIEFEFKPGYVAESLVRLRVDGMAGSMKIIEKLL
ncbi:MAG: beta-galactosidase [Spirochaetota bacterium]